MDQDQLQQLVEEISITYFHKPFLHVATFNSRLRTTGGRYLLKSHDIELNPKYYNEQGMDSLIGIIKHELCHYHLHIEGKGYKHRDKAFRLLLNKVGGPRFCKPLSSIQEEYKYTYECTACRSSFKRKRNINLIKYVCGKCRGKLRKIE